MNNELAYLMTCSKAIQDFNTKLFSYIDVFNVVFLQKSVKKIQLSFFVVGKVLNVTAGPVKIELKLYDPTKVAIVSMELDSNANAGDMELAIQVPLITFEKSGKHTLEVKLNDKVITDDGHFILVKEV